MGDLHNTVLHIVGDHGSLVGESTSTQFGRLESTNPVSILFAEPISQSHLFNDSVLRSNEQRFVSHFDFHLFYKQIPLLFSPLYSMKDFGVPTNGAINIYKNIVSVNRSCSQLSIPKAFCFCAMPIYKQVTNKLIASDFIFIKFVIATKNTMTGRGQFDCLTLNESDFLILSHAENGNDIQLVLQQKQNRNQTKTEYIALKKQNKILTFFVYIERLPQLRIPKIERDGMSVPLIDRLDYFKFEQCITRNYDIAQFKAKGSEFRDLFKTTNNKLPPVVFKNINYTKALLRELKPNGINLRLCKCK